MQFSYLCYHSFFTRIWNIM